MGLSFEAVMRLALLQSEQSGVEIRRKKQNKKTDTTVKTW